MNGHNRFAGVFLLLLVLVGGACGGLTQSDKPATVKWWLNPFTGTAVTAPASPPLPVELSVTAVPGLDTDRILALSDDAELKPFIGASWVDYVPELVDSLVGRSLEASGRFKVITAGTSRGTESCALQLEIRKFFAELDASGQARVVQVALSGSYQCGAGESSPLRLSATVAANDQRMKVIVAAFQSALDKVMKDMLAQLP
jgi:ABC-type uncharacterized transport system auxiliary subunit